MPSTGSSSVQVTSSNAPRPPAPPALGENRHPKAETYSDFSASDSPGGHVKIPIVGPPIPDLLIWLVWGLRISIHRRLSGDAADPGTSCPVVSSHSGIPGRPRNTPSVTQLWGLSPSAFFFPLSEGKGGRGARMRIFKCLFKDFAT